MPGASSSTVANFRPGLIEGFFGRPWSWQGRQETLDFMARAGLSAYIYAPKDDRWLRKAWATPFPQAHLDNLISLATHARSLNVPFGIGLSPYGLYQDFSDSNRRRLDEKLAQIHTVAPDLLCVLFDDMPGDTPELAARQTAIMRYIMDQAVAKDYLFCPTYYSFDPVLETHFGPRPPDYLETLGNTLPAEVDIFWTGPQVVSQSYPAEHLQTVAALLQRKPVLWDNYPVNDGRNMVDFLHLQPVARDTALIRRYCAGHFLNPMNQCSLSRIPILGILQQYEAGHSDGDWLTTASRSLCSPELAERLMADCALFQNTGLRAMTAAQNADLQQRYAAFAGQAYADEVLAWLRGEFAFDPACLT